MKFLSICFLAIVMHLAASAASAVTLSSSGQGQVLIYPYYSVRNNYATLFSMVNTTDAVKAVHAVFKEGKGGVPTLDFNIYLGPKDTWTGVVIDDSQTARLYTLDLTCTVPAIPIEGVDFRPFAYQGDVYQDDSVDRAREGSLVLIEMGTVAAGDGQIGINAFHPEPQCDAFNAAWLSGGIWDTDPHTDLLPPTGGLMGSASLIQIEQGHAVDMPITALVGFRQSALHAMPGSYGISLASAEPAMSSVWFENRIVHSGWSENPVQAVSAVLAAYGLNNEFVFDDITASGSDWVFSQPTRDMHVSPQGDPTLPPFGDRLADEHGLCLGLFSAEYDRDGEQQFGICSAKDANGKTSPCPPPGGICWATTVVSREQPSEVLGSELGFGLFSPLANGEENGWIEAGFLSTDQAMTSDEGHVHHGAPTVGFAISTYRNGVIDGILRNYGIARPHVITQMVDDGLDQ